MEQIIVKNIPENKLGFFIELVKNLGFSVEKTTVEKKLTKKQQEIITELKDSLNQVDLHLQGKIQLKTADQLLNEL